MGLSGNPWHETGRVSAACGSGMRRHPASPPEWRAASSVLPSELARAPECGGGEVAQAGDGTPLRRHFHVISGLGLLKSPGQRSGVMAVQSSVRRFDSARRLLLLAQVGGTARDFAHCEFPVGYGDIPWAEYLISCCPRRFGSPESSAASPEKVRAAPNKRPRRRRSRHRRGWSVDS